MRQSKSFNQSQMSSFALNACPNKVFTLQILDKAHGMPTTKPRRGFKNANIYKPSWDLRTHGHVRCIVGDNILNGDSLLKVYSKYLQSVYEIFRPGRGNPPGTTRHTKSTKKLWTQPFLSVKLLFRFTLKISFASAKKIHLALNSAFGDKQILKTPRTKCSVQVFQPKNLNEYCFNSRHPNAWIICWPCFVVVPLPLKLNVNCVSSFSPLMCSHPFSRVLRTSFRALSFFSSKPLFWAEVPALVLRALN